MESGPCSAACGYGVSRQKVVCMQTVAGIDTEVEPKSCPSHERPLSAVPCFITQCFYTWDLGPWTKVQCTGHIQSFLPLFNSFKCFKPKSTDLISTSNCKAVLTFFLMETCHVRIILSSENANCLAVSDLHLKRTILRWALG